MAKCTKPNGAQSLSVCWMINSVASECLVAAQIVFI